MNKKVISTLVITTFILALLPLALAGNTENAPRMMTQEIGASRAPPTTSKPDLIVFSIAFAPTAPTTADAVTITATIENTGLGQSGTTTVEFFDDGTSLGTQNIGRIKAGKTAIASKTASFPAGTHTIKAVVDPAGTVAETNEGNNEKTASLTVLPAEPIQTHDVATLDVTPSKTTIKPGDQVSISVNVANQGTFTESPTTSVYYGANLIGTKTTENMLAGATTQLTFNWDTTNVLPGTYTVSAKTAPVLDETELSDNDAKYEFVTVVTAEYSLTIEIDYMTGHKPTQEVLDYMQNYYAERGIAITYDIATSPVPLDTSVSTTDFWNIEKQYNAAPDNANGNSGNGKYDIPYKWVLFGTTVQGSPGTVGYTYVTTSGTDLLAGNYIYMADQTADNWAGSNTDLQKGAEATVLMHEFGHSIGIAQLSIAGSEVYCSNYECVMSYLRTQNADNIGTWYYCDTHWGTKNLGYYSIP